MNLRPAPQDAASWLPAALEVMDRNARIPTAPTRPQEEPCGGRWSDEEDERLVAMLTRKIRVAVVAGALGRTPESVHNRTRLLRKEGAL